MSLFLARLRASLASCSIAFFHSLLPCMLALVGACAAQRPFQIWRVQVLPGPTAPASLY